MKCFVDGCKNASDYNHGGFCERHWNMLRQSLRTPILDAIRLLRESRKRALESLVPPDA